MSEYTRWYRVGSVALTKNSKIITGTGTFWLAAGLNPGDLFTVDASQFYEVSTIDSNTQITLKTAYSGDTTSETEYSIVRNFTASLPAQVAAQTADLLNDFRQFVDLKMQSIHGKSAYQIACEKGYTGTESQWVASLKGDSAYQVAVANGYTGNAEEWLESLKAAGEWATAQESIAALNTTVAALNANGLAHNAIYRGKNLGTKPTAEQVANIRNGTFKDMYLGDYWYNSANGWKYIIAHFNYYNIWGYSADPLLQRNHVVVIDDGYTRNAMLTPGQGHIRRWVEDGVTEFPATGYKDCYQDQHIQGTLTEALLEYLSDTNCVLQHPRHITQGVDVENWTVTSQVKQNVYLDVPTEQMLYGFTKYSLDFDVANYVPLALGDFAQSIVRYMWGGKCLRQLGTWKNAVFGQEHGKIVGTNFATGDREIRTFFVIG